METNKLIIADSSAIISLAITSDQNHQRAMSIVGQLRPEMYTVIIPCEVFSETVNILGKKFGHAAAIEAIEIIDESGLFVIEDSGLDVRTAALEWFGAMAEGVSYTDCIVMAVANATNTPFVFGFDETFNKNGFRLPQGRAAA